MKVLYNPVRSDDVLVYEFHSDAITVLLNGQSEVFDFSTMLDGELNEVLTSLPVNPIVKAERKNGELFLTLLHFHGEDASEDELFPVEKVIGDVVDISESPKAKLTFITQSELDAIQNAPREKTQLELMQEQIDQLILDSLMGV